MSQENTNSQSPQQSSETTPVLRVPVPPPSANIGGGKTTTHAMDSAENVRTFITESEKK